MKKDFIEKRDIAYSIKLWMAGDSLCARPFILRNMADKPRGVAGNSVTITDTVFAYPGGEEAGFVVGFINYPRFPHQPTDIQGAAIELGKQLCWYLGQGSFLVETPSSMIWFSRRDED